MKCANQDCDKVTEIGALDSHIKECQYTKIMSQYEGCRLMIKRVDLFKHDKECEYRLQKCEKCESEYKTKEELDCIKYLKNLLLQQGESLKKLQDVVLIQQQNIEKLIAQNAQKMQSPQCLVGHQLQWKANHNYIKCISCQLNRDCRYHCLSCNISFCQGCREPVFNQQKCPGNHDLNLVEKPRQTIVCDFCRQKPYDKNEPVWSDRACNFDIF